jgi:hypothetical protein
MDISPKDELEHLLKRVAIRSATKLPCSVMLDRGALDDPGREFETFDLFFAMPAAVGDRIDPDTVDGHELLDSLIEGSCELILDRFKQLLPGFDGPISTIGLSTEVEWAFGSEVLEAEAMLGDFWDETAIPGRLTFYARYVAPIDQQAGRCRTAPPPKLPTPTRPAPWARESEAEEELRDPPLSWFEP